MIRVTASKLRQNLFDFLDKATSGEIIVIQRNNKDVARLVPAGHSNWRDKMRINPRILVPPDELVKPIDDIWEGYA